MKKLRPTVLKIGGSVITEKNKEFHVRMEAMNRLAEEIQEANSQNLVIVHGGGSFGHPLAEKYAIIEGFKEETQKIGFSETHHIMTVLNGLFMDALIGHDVPAISVTPSSCIVTEKGRIRHLEDTLLKRLLKMGFYPVLYGDAVLDSELGFTILSGDQLVSVLATKLNARHIIMGVDVDGLYNNDPKTEKSARMYRRLILEDLKRIHRKLDKPTACDVTGGMPKKIVELIPAIEQGIPVTIVNATKPHYVCKTLKGEKVKSTLIEKE